MRRRYSLGHLILGVVVALSLTPLMIVVDAQEQIAFVSNRDGNFEIYVMDADGGNQQNLTNNPAWDGSPSWSPDGRRIVFESRRDGHVMNGIPTAEIYVMDADGGNQQNLTNNPSHDGSPCWSPDGKRIAFDSDRDGRFNWEIYVIDTDGGNLQRLTNNPDDDGHPDDRYPSWSPDGKQIVFSARREGHVEIKFDVTYEIYVMDANGGNQQRLTNNRNNELSPVWSPDGERIAFTSDRKGNFENFEIYVMDANGGNQQRLTNNRILDWGPSWSPDSKRIAFKSWRDGNSEIYVMDADGGNQQNLTNNRHGDGSPAWLNSPFSVAPAGKTLTIWGRVKQVNR
ncbi:hypothetical protein C6502_20770 [Candidatus Poribacteria bacterium]|nr:MAG: hypothetical protein C6502_20770 [Candidatus Poribacteria bacterium]